MSNTREPNKGTVNKNLKALVELQWRLNEGMDVSGLRFSKELKLSGAWWGVALKKGIIKKDGRKGKLTIYKWNTKQPDRQMARALTLCISKYNRDLTARREKKKATKEAHAWVEDVVSGAKTPFITGRVSEALKEVVKEMPKPDTRKIEDFPVVSYDVVKPLPKEQKEVITLETTYFGIFKVRRVWVRTVIK